MGPFHGYISSWILPSFYLFRVPIVFALAPPDGFREQLRAGPWPGPHGHISGISTAFNPGSSAACLTRRPCLVCHCMSRPISCPACRGRPQAESLAGRWGRVLARAVGWVRLRVTRIAGMHFSRSSEGEVFPPSAVLPKKGLGEYPHAANFSKYFFMSRRIRSLRLITARWVTPIRRAYSLVERWS